MVEHFGNFTVTRLIPLFLALLVPTASAQLPSTRLDGVFPPGGSPGQALDLTIFGGDLDDVDKLIFSNPGITAQPKMADPTPFDEGKQQIPNQFTVSIATNVAPGRYEVRCQGKYGISGPRAFTIDQLRELNETEPNSQQNEATALENLPLVVNGQLNSAADIDWYSFKGNAGQRISIDCFARRIDSRADAVIVLTSEEGQVIAQSRRAKAGDPFLDITLPSSGTYYVRIYDSLYGGGGEYSYRIAIGSFPSIDFVFPPAGVPGSTVQFTIYGTNLPGGKRSGVKRHGKELETLTVSLPIPASASGTLDFSERLDPHQSCLDGFEYRVKTGNSFSNPALITLATAPSVTELSDNDSPQTAQQLNLPCEVMGQFYPQRDTDWYSFNANAGDTYWLEVYSHRLGLPTDPTLVIQQVTVADSGEEQVKQLAWIDDVRLRDGGFEFDERTHDPSYKFTAPADGKYRVLIREGYSSLVSDPSLVYRFAIRKGSPDYRVAAVPVASSSDIFLRKGGRAAIRVVVFRQDGFDGVVQVTTKGLPAGVTASELTLGPASNTGLVTLTATDKAEPKVGYLELTATAQIGDRTVQHKVRLGHPLQQVTFAQPNNRNQASLRSRLTERLPVIVSETETSAVLLTLTEPKTFETSRGGIIKLKYTVKRADGVGGNISAYPVGLPPNTTPTQFNLGANKAGDLELRLRSNTPTGTYSVSLAATMQGMRYSRNPEAAEAAKKRADRIGKMSSDAQKTTRQLEQENSKAQTALNQANTALAQAKSAQSTADQLVKSTAQTAKAAEQEMTAAKSRLASNPEDTNLKKLFTSAQAKLKDTQEKMKSATAGAASAGTKLTENVDKQSQAEVAKTESDKSVKEAREFQQKAQVEKRNADREYSRLRQVANPRGTNHVIASNPIVIKITDYPITLTSPTNKLVVKQGEKLEIPVSLKRLYDFKQNVNLTLNVPRGVAGLGIRNMNIAQNKTEAKLTVTAQPTATPGDHELVIRASMNVNGQNLTLERPISITVQKVEKTK